MNDSELLDFAADAAGLRIKDAMFNEFSGALESLICKKYDGPETEWISWNPLNNDGDALRLAVKLNLDLMLSPSHGKFAESIYEPRVKESGFPEGDPYAATRRAIVKAAAAIGKAMP